MKKIFIVDDEKNIRELLKKYLVKENFQVTMFENGDNLISSIQKELPDLIVLDIMMPGLDGIELCKNIRSFTEVPIIFISAKDDDIDKILGLEIGGDDYLTKPFSPRELLARIKNIFKRVDSTKCTKQESAIKVGNLSLNSLERDLKVDGQSIELTKKEFDVLEYMLININIPLSRNQMIENIWNFESSGEERLVDDLVKRIRKKLSQAGSEINIKTVWGFGYKIEN